MDRVCQGSHSRARTSWAHPYGSQDVSGCKWHLTPHVSHPTGGHELPVVRVKDKLQRDNSFVHLCGRSDNGKYLWNLECWRTGSYSGSSSVEEKEKAEWCMASRGLPEWPAFELSRHKPARPGGSGLLVAFQVFCLSLLNNPNHFRHFIEPMIKLLHYSADALTLKSLPLSWESDVNKTQGLINILCMKCIYKDTF